MQVKNILIIALTALLAAMLTQSGDKWGGRAEGSTWPVSQAETMPVAELTQLMAMMQITPLLDAPPDAPPDASPPTGPINRVTMRFRQHRGNRIEITPEFLDQCMDVAEQVNPKWARMMRDMCERRPEDFERYLRQTGRQLVGLVQLKQRDPDLYATKMKELHLEAHLKAMNQKLRVLYAEGLSDSSEAIEMRSELRVLVQEQVALALKSRGDYIIRLEEHVGTLKRQLEDDALNFFRTVEERYQVLTTMP